MATFRFVRISLTKLARNKGNIWLSQNSNEQTTVCIVHFETNSISRFAIFQQTFPCFRNTLKHDLTANKRSVKYLCASIIHTHKRKFAIYVMTCIREAKKSDVFLFESKLNTLDHFFGIGILETLASGYR